MCVCQVDLCVNFVDLHIMKKHLNYWELWKIVTVCWILQGWSCKGVVVLCKTCEVVNGELKRVVFLFYVLSIWGVVSWVPIYVIYLDLGVYVTNYNLGLGFLWKFNVILGLCGVKILRKKGRLVCSRERDKRDLTL